MFQSWRARFNKYFWLGLLVLIAYWFSVRPAGIRGYIEDFCIDLSRRAMSENLAQNGKPTFWSDLFMAPFGMPVPFFSWSIERDWLGAYLWRWNKDFPFLWFYFLFSLVGAYVVTGAILRKMGLGRASAWIVAAFVGLVHIPRHFKTWYHVEYLAQHWVYWSLFLDAYLWQRWIRERRWSTTIELWRGVCMLGVLGTPGYFWGPMVLEWALVRVGMLLGLALIQAKGRSEDRIQVEFSVRQAILPILLCCFFVVIDLRWFIPLVREMKAYGEIFQQLSWFANLGYVARPLWLDTVWGWIRATGLVHGNLPPVDKPETVVSIGWCYWIPMLLGVWLVRKRAGGVGFRVIAPFFLLLWIGIFYFGVGGPYFLQDWIRAVVPFMAFFRVTCRWGALMPQICTVVIVLCWPELRAWWRRTGHRKTALLAVFVFLSAIEAKWLLLPVKMLPELDPSTTQLLNGIKEARGTTVLDLPFCVAGGNGVCTSEQCPQYPKSTVGACFSSWHEKKVYGLYQARLVPSQCQIYNRAPYTSWFSAWSQQRCFTEAEWNDFCGYLDQHQELSAILFYPEIWWGAGTASCMQEFVKRLGPPISGGYFSTLATRGGKPAEQMRVFRFEPRCRTGK